MKRKSSLPRTERTLSSPRMIPLFGPAGLKLVVPGEGIPEAVRKDREWCGREKPLEWNGPHMDVDQSGRAKRLIGQAELLSVVGNPPAVLQIVHVE